MTSKQELRDRLAARTTEVVTLRREVNGLNRLLTEAQSNQARAVRERDDLRAQLAARQSDAPEPRPFRVGDRVRVAEGATWRGGDVRPRSAMSGRSGAVWRVYSDGDVSVRADDGVQQDAVSPEFCTLIEDEPTAAPDPTTPAPSVRVRVVYESGSLSQDFDADGIAVMEAAPVYALLKDGDVVACVPVAGVRSVEVVR